MYLLQSTSLLLTFYAIVIAPDSSFPIINDYTSLCQPQRYLNEVVDLDRHSRGFITLDLVQNRNTSSAFECSWLLKFSNQTQLPLDEQKVVVLKFVEFDLASSNKDDKNITVEDNCLDNFVEIWSGGETNNAVADLRAVHCGTGRVPAFYGGLQRPVLVKLTVANHVTEPSSKLTFSVQFSTKFVGSVPSGREVEASVPEDEFLCPPRSHFVCFFNGLPRCRLNSNWCDSVSDCDDMADEKNCDGLPFKFSEQYDQEGDAEFEDISDYYSDGDAEAEDRTWVDSGCGSPRNQMGLHGSFHSPNYPCDYPSNLTCVWDITTPPDSHILIAFNSIFSISAADEDDVGEDAGKCPYDNLIMFYSDGGKKTAIGSACGYKKPASKIIKTNKITVNFETFRPKSDRVFHGFRLQWTAYSREASAGIKAEKNPPAIPTRKSTTLAPLIIDSCSPHSEGVALTSLQGDIESPSYGVSFYPASTVCLWRIEPNFSLAVGFHFSISLEFVYFEVDGSSKCERGDWLEVTSIDLLSGSQHQNRYCSSNRPPQNNGETIDVKTTKPIQLKFTSNNDKKQNYGFKISYQVKIVEPKKQTSRVKKSKFVHSGTICGVVASPIANSQFFGSADDERDNIVNAIGAVKASIADPNDWPWIVQLSIKKTHMCSASVINERWLLTAAHCFKGRFKSTTWWTLTIGMTSLNSQTAWDNSPLIHVRIKNILIHRRYSKQKGKEFDIALIKLQEPLSFNSRFVKPICFPSRKTQLDDHCFVAGWGRASPKTRGKRLLESLRIPLISLEKCQRLTQQLWATVTGTMLCGGYLAGGTGVCHGDSGGPLICRVGNRWELHGVVAFEGQCALPNSPAIFTRVYSYVSWISSVMSKFVA